MKEDNIAARYARGLIKTVKKDEEYREIKSELEYFLSLVKADSEFKAGMETTLFSREEKRELLDEIHGRKKFNRYTYKLLLEMIEKNRMGIMTALIPSVEKAWFEENNIEKFKVFSAVALSPKLEQKIIENLEKSFAKKIVLEKEIDKSLIAGIKIQRGFVYYDFSMNRNLRKLKETIASGTPPAIAPGQEYKMEIKADEISEIIKQKIAGFEKGFDKDETGIVIYVGDGIAHIYGLENVMYNELIEFPGKIPGIALNLEEDMVGAIILGDPHKIKEGDKVRRTGRIISVPVGNELVGRVVDPLGNPLDDKGPIDARTYLPIERLAPGVVDRQPVNEPLQTGIKAIDAMIPIGRGQRELIIGDRQTGKTAIAIDTIINQKARNVVCVYVAIGQKQSTIAQVIKTLEDTGAMDYSIVVAAGASSPAALQYIAPYAGCAMGEYFRDNKQHSLLIYDDLSKHAAAYREISLLLRRPPGREAYPGDVFYLHSRLLERAAKYSAEKGGGSLTALPIIETQASDVSGYIPTNVISITDGQIYLLPDLFNRGQRPAIDVGISVSRVGGKAQIKAMKQVAGRLKLDLAQFRELEAFTQFGSDLDKATIDQLERGKRLSELLKQNEGVPMPVANQVIVIFAGANGFLDEFPVDSVGKYEEKLLEFVEQEQEYKHILNDIREKREIDPKLEQEMKKMLLDFAREFRSFLNR